MTNLSPHRRPKRLSGSFIGLDTPGCYALRAGLPAKTVNPIEKDEHVCCYLSKHLGYTVVAIDARDVDVSKMEDAEVFHAGFPCTPFARGGKGEGFEDKDGMLYYVTIDHAAELRKRGKLTFLILENSAAILEERLSQDASILEMQRYFRGKFQDWLPLSVIFLGGRFNNAPMDRNRCTRCRMAPPPPPTPNHRIYEYTLHRDLHRESDINIQ